MRIAITEQDIALVKKSAKIYRQHCSGKIGQQKALDHISVLLGYQDYFNLNSEKSISRETSEKHDFEKQIQPSLKANGFKADAIESLLSVFGRLSAFNAASRPPMMFYDEYSHHAHHQSRIAGSDVVDLLSGLGLPRYEWWISGRKTNIHEPSVVILDKVIPAVRELQEEQGWRYPEHCNKGQITDYIQSEIFNSSRISAYEAVSDFEFDIKPFGFRVEYGDLTKDDNTCIPVWTIFHATTRSFLEPVFDTRERAFEALSYIAITGSLHSTIDSSKNGVICFPTCPKENTVNARVFGGKIVAATDKSEVPSNTAHHVIDAHGFKLIQFLNLDDLRLDINSLDYLGDLNTGVPVNDALSRSYPFLPSTAERMHGALSEKTFNHLRQLESKLYGLTSTSNITLPLAQNIIDWLRGLLVPVNYETIQDHHYEFDKADMAKHLPQLSKCFPSDLLDMWYYDYFNDTQGCRPYGQLSGDPREFIAYLCYIVIKDNTFTEILKEALKPDDSISPPDAYVLKVGTVLLKLMLQQKSGDLELGVLCGHRRMLIKWLDTFDYWKREIADVEDGLEHLKADAGMISHGDMRTTKTDLFRISRKYNVNVVEQTMN